MQTAKAKYPADWIARACRKRSPNTKISGEASSKPGFVRCIFLLARVEDANGTCPR
jgi:hypothetical protein